MLVATILLFGVVLSLTGGGMAQPTHHPLSSGTGADPLLLALSPSPAQGSAPLAVEVVATATGGTPPYTLASVCFGDGTCAAGLSDWGGTATDFDHIYSQSGTFSITSQVSDSAGGNATSSARVVATSFVPLEVTITTSGANGSAPWGVDFTAHVSGGSPPYSLQWNYGDGTQGSAIPGAPANHVFESAGTFHPVLTVSDSAGHQVSASSPTVKVLAPAPSGSSTSSALPPALALVAVLVMVGVEQWHSLRAKREGQALLLALKDVQGKP